MGKILPFRNGPRRIRYLHQLPEELRNSLPPIVEGTDNAFLANQTLIRDELERIRRGQSWPGDRGVWQQKLRENNRDHKSWRESMHLPLR